MGTPLDLLSRLPDENRRVLNLGAGYCSSPISEQIPKIPFKSLVNVEVWPGSFAKLDAILFAAGSTENVCEDALSYVLKYFEKDIFDVVLMIDVLEHFDKSHAIALLNRCRWISERVVIFLPIGTCPQDALEGNPYQKHLSTWELGDFSEAHVEYLPKFHEHFNPPVDAAWVIYDKRSSLPLPQPITL